MARLSCGDKCTHSLLLNTHYDSTISTMGAGGKYVDVESLHSLTEVIIDSAVAAAAMLELVRAYTQGDYELKNSLLLGSDRLMHTYLYMSISDEVFISCSF